VIGASILRRPWHRCNDCAELTCTQNMQNTTAAFSLPHEQLWQLTKDWRDKMEIDEYVESVKRSETDRECAKTVRPVVYYRVKDCWKHLTGRWHNYAQSIVSPELEERGAPLFLSHYWLSPLVSLVFRGFHYIHSKVTHKSNQRSRWKHYIFKNVFVMLGIKL